MPLELPTIGFLRATNPDSRPRLLIDSPAPEAAFTQEGCITKEGGNLLIGPVFTREVTTTPRSWRLYLMRAVYVGALFGLVLTAWLIL